MAFDTAALTSDLATALTASLRAKPSNAPITRQQLLKAKQVEQVVTPDGMTNFDQMTKVRDEAIAKECAELASAIAGGIATGLAARFQTGTATLASGTATISGVTLRASSVIALSRKTVGGTVTSTVQYEAPSAQRDTVAGTFVVRASVAAGTINASDGSTLDWELIG